MKITDVRFNGVKSPVGFDFERLLVSWKVREARGKTQAAAELRLYENNPDSEPVLTITGDQVKQSGTALSFPWKMRTDYFAEIKVTDETGDHAESGKISFTTGKRKERWNADWIAAEEGDSCHPILRKSFSTKKGIRMSRFYGTGVGIFELYLNGVKQGREYLAPYVTNYEKHLQTFTYKVDKDIREGEENTIELLLGKGWYLGTFGLEGMDRNYGSRMAAIGELHITYLDGTEEVICTDESWTYHASDFEDSGIYLGEILNRELWRGKENPERPVSVIRDPAHTPGCENLIKEHLSDRLSLPVVVKEELPVKEIVKTPAGETVLDFGQNFAGFVRFHAAFPAGTTVKLEFGEILQEGNFYHKNYRDAVSELVYTSDGREETVETHFTFYGFRYVKISGFPGEVEAADFTGCVLYSDLDRTGFIETGDARFDRLYQNTIWGQRSNFIDIPTDCPQRSERLGWTGDTQVFAPTACYHTDTRSFYHKFIRDLLDEQEFLDGGVPNYVPNIGHKDDCGAVWGDIATLLPETLYQAYGDLSEAEYAYPLMKNWVDWIDRGDRARGERKYLNDFVFTFGDWLALDGATPTSFKGSTDDTFIATAYYYRSAEIVADMAERLGKKEDAEYYRSLSEQIRSAFYREFYTPSGRLSIDTQAAYVVALKFRLHPDRKRVIAQFKERLKKDLYSIKCGFVGAPLLCTVLAECGETELAYDYLLKEGFPGWLYEVDLGATTIWERWNSVGEDGVISDTGMNSLNHYAYGSVMEFVYAYAAGIRPAEPGYKRAVIEPRPDIRLPKLSASYDSVQGKYAVAYELREDGSVHMEIEVPFDCTAEVTLPRDPEGKRELSAGSYRFDYVPEQNFRKPYGERTHLSRLAKDPRAMEILGKYVPVAAGIAASGDPENGTNTLMELMGMSFFHIDPEKMKEALAEIKELRV